MCSVASYDVFISYAHGDRAQTIALRDALTAHGLSVWLDESEIDTFASITAAVATGLAHSKVLVAYYSREYPSRRACQWELTAAFLAAQRAGDDPRKRVLVVNPEQATDHLHPVELRDALFVQAAEDGGELDAVARRITEHVQGLEGNLGELGVSDDPPWFGRQPVGAARFVGRLKDMWAVHSALSAAEARLLTGSHGDPAVKVTGMGGIGKSLLVQEYALRFGAGYEGGVFWLRARGNDAAEQSLSTEARDAERDAQLLAFTDALGVSTADLEPRQLRAALRKELDARGKRFLWIVDDLPGALSSVELEQWLAPSSSGRTLVTTRSRDYAGIGSQIELGVLHLQEGLELLAKHRPPDGPDEEDAARGIVNDLGGHALALDVAGSALRAELGVRSLASYREALSDLDVDELELAADFAGELPGGHEACIVSTFARSIRRLEDPGRDFLRLASKLAVEPIAAELVVQVFARIDGLEEEMARRRAVSAMHEAVQSSLADMTDNGDRQVHTLVSRTMHVLERASSRSAALADAATVVLAEFLGAFEHTRGLVGPVTLAHARELVNPTNSMQRVALLRSVARQELYRGNYGSARILQEWAVAALLHLGAEEHPDIAQSLGELGTILQGQGDLAAARRIQEQVLGIHRRLLGDEHADTLGSILDLASTMLSQGDLAVAGALQHDVLTVAKKAFGDEHDVTRTSMNDLSATLFAQEDFDGARAVQEQVLPITIRVLGDEHPNTLTSMNNLAETMRAQGDLGGARALHERTEAIRWRVLGTDHPDSLQSTSNLACTLALQGDLQGARALHELVLSVRRQQLGDDHPTTVGSMNNLAWTLRQSGDLVGARALQEKVLLGCMEMLGDDHPNTLASISGLEDTLREQGDLDAVRLLREQILVRCQHGLGDDHPRTLDATNNLAVALTDNGDLDGARAVLEHLLTTCRRVLGDDHPATLMVKGAYTDIVAQLDGA
jgi:hypothetical protein